MGIIGASSRRVSPGKPPRRLSISDDRRRRPGDGRPVWRQGQLGAAQLLDELRSGRQSVLRWWRSTSTRATKYKHELIASTCQARGWELHIEHPTSASLIGRHAGRGCDTLLVVRSLPARGRHRRDRGRSDEDCARAPRRRLHRDAPAESVLRGIAEGDARQARIRQRRARRDPAAGVPAKTRRARIRKSAACRSSAAVVPRAATWDCSASGRSAC